MQFQLSIPTTSLLMKRLIFITLALLLASGANAQFWKKQKNNDQIKDSIAGQQRLNQVFDLIFDHYVSSPDMDKLSAEAINSMLKSLDPHSIYIPAKEVQRTNEGLVGNFEGVGISFQIVKDTIVVADVIPGGPAEKVGVQLGDKFIRIDSAAATGDSINNSFVTNHLRGPKGTKVVCHMLRQGQPITFDIIRDKIPIYSVETSFMVDDSIGYIRLIRFARTSVQEFNKALRDLEKQGLKRLILDLRGNSGGYLDIACGLANEFIPAQKLLVYTQGREKRQNFVSNRHGSFRQGPLVVLIDEGSASASEIVSGAIQDWDRGLIVGRRSFGKGLVQRMYSLNDGGQIRLTTARYYTPSGRCIQKPYDDGTDAYRKDIDQRYASGELVNADSIHFPDSLKFKTAGGRTVYGGGGIMPDIFVPMDTTRLSDYYVKLRAKGLLNTFPMNWAQQHRNDPLVKDFDSFLAHYNEFSIDSLFAAEALSLGILHDTVAEAADPLRTQRTAEYLAIVLKASIARDLFGNKYYYLVSRIMDEGYKRAVNAAKEMR